jgi:hypothetical protein
MDGAGCDNDISWYMVGSDFTDFDEHYFAIQRVLMS